MDNKDSLNIAKSSLQDIDEFNKRTGLSISYENGRFALLNKLGQNRYSFDSIQRIRFYNSSSYILTNGTEIQILNSSLEEEYTDVKKTTMKIPSEKGYCREEIFIDQEVYVAKQGEDYWVLNVDLRKIVASKYPIMRYVQKDLMLVSANKEDWFLYIPSNFSSQEYYSERSFFNCIVEALHDNTYTVRDGNQLYLWSKEHDYCPTAHLNLCNLNIMAQLFLS